MFANQAIVSLKQAIRRSLGHELEEIREHDSFLQNFDFLTWWWCGGVLFIHSVLPAPPSQFLQDLRPLLMGLLQLPRAQREACRVLHVGARWRRESWRGAPRWRSTVASGD